MTAIRCVIVLHWGGQRGVHCGGRGEGGEGGGMQEDSSSNGRHEPVFEVTSRISPRASLQVWYM